MATITVKNIPDDLYERLKQAAAVNRRSINSEIIVCIERAVEGLRPSDEEMLERARSLRLLTAAHPLTAEEIQQAIDQGRP